MQTNKSLEEVQDLILQHTCTLGSENISILAALGRVSSLYVNAPENRPGRDQSAIDGFALSGQVEVLPGQKPSMIRSLLQCNALIDVPANSPAIDAGKEVSVIILGT